MAVHLRGFNPEREMHTSAGKAYARIHISKHFVGTECGWCKRVYTDVDDFIARDPRRGANGSVIDGICWKSYDTNVQGGDGSKE